jgi:excinuclease UvrABC ATPase subunit
MSIQFEASNDKLQELGLNTGVDFLALKKKYAETKAKQVPPESVFNVTGQGMDTLGARGAAESTADAEAAKAVLAKQDAAKAAFSALDDYYICKTCNGRGLVKEVYNHMVLEKNCPDCDGECVMKKVVKVDVIKAQNDKILADNAALVTATQTEAEVVDPSVSAPSKPHVGPNLK